MRHIVLQDVTVHILKAVSLVNQLPCNYSKFGLGGHGVTRSPRNPRFAGPNPTEVDGVFQKASNRRPSMKAVRPVIASNGVPYLK